MLRLVALVTNYFSEEHIASIVRVTGIGEQGTALAITSNLLSVLRLLATANIVPSSPILVTLMMLAICSSEISVLKIATRRHIP
jgi:hypothetical protein